MAWNSCIVRQKKTACKKDHVTRSRMNMRCDWVWQYTNPTNGFCNERNSKGVSSLFFSHFLRSTFHCCSQLKSWFGVMNTNFILLCTSEPGVSVELDAVNIVFSVEMQVKRYMRDTWWMTFEPKLRSIRFMLPHFMIACAQHMKAPGSNWIPYSAHCTYMYQHTHIYCNTTIRVFCTEGTKYKWKKSPFILLDLICEKFVRLNSLSFSLSSAETKPLRVFFFCFCLHYQYVCNVWIRFANKIYTWNVHMYDFNSIEIQKCILKCKKIFHSR